MKQKSRNEMTLGRTNKFTAVNVRSDPTRIALLIDGSITVRRQAIDANAKNRITYTLLAEIAGFEREMKPTTTIT
jgi:hypothetical protein